ncbi:hypothetical protein DE146DRAFT_615659 [Phaeosphaeria sp. MPI-PUGE-AT-0046c]|nr:hypothetical protein DE146DRAFT_615659 [Phaeosphaeria sp. MPI-PUGE-AT-0046c]
MVGVAGKSKACHDCKRRRVKCDLVKPCCLRCEKVGLACRGYDKNTIFVNRTLSKQSARATAAVSETRLCSSYPVQHSASDLFRMFSQLNSSMCNTVIHPPLFRLDALKILQELYLPRTKNTDPLDLTAVPCFSWAHAVCHLAGESKVLDESLLAFCAIQISIREPQTTPGDAAFQLYDKAISSLVNSLGYIHEQVKDETLAAIIVLSTCELFIFASDEGWRAHAHGISQLLRHRSAMDERSLLWLRLCSRLRVICVIIALSQGTRLALSPGTWAQLLDADNTNKSFEDLMDIVSEVPSLLESCDALQPPTNNEDLLRSLLGRMTNISSWQQSYRLELHILPYWAVPSQLHHPSDDKFAARLFPLVLEYQSLVVATLFIFSSTAMLKILLVALRLANLSSRGSRASKTRAIRGDVTIKHSNTIQFCYTVVEMQTEADRLARLLCQSMEYCLRQEMGTLGLQVNCLSQSVLRGYFWQAGRERELDWVRNISKAYGPGFLCGMKMMLFHHEQDEV